MHRIFFEKINSQLLSLDLWLISIVVASFFINQQGNCLLTVGGVKSLSQFSTEQIILGIRNGHITVNGEAFEILRFDENEIQICGIITSVGTEVLKRNKIKEGGRDA